MNKKQNWNEVLSSWTTIENLKKDGPRELADYLTVKYTSLLVKKIKYTQIGIDNLEAHELASDVMYEFIKNDYQKIKSLDRSKGSIRGLLSIIVKRKIYKLRNKKSELISSHLDNQEGYYSEDFEIVCMDLNDAIKKMQENSPRLYEAFILYYFENNKVVDIANFLDVKESAVKKRLSRARLFLDDAMGWK